MEFNNAQLRELSSTWNPDLYWFDGDWEHSAEEWKAADVIKLIRSYNQNVIVNSRIQGHGDYDTPELGVPVSRPKSKWWETCMTINDSWGDRIEYTPNEFINILKEHKNELLVSLEERLCNSTRDFLSHAYVKCSRCEKEMTYRSELPRNYEFLHMGEDQKLHYDPKQSECYCVDCFFEIQRGESND